MKVYVVGFQNYDGVDIVGIYLDEKRARKEKEELDNLKCTPDGWMECYEVE